MLSFNFHDCHDDFHFRSDSSTVRRFSITARKQLPPKVITVDEEAKKETSPNGDARDTAKESSPGDVEMDSVSSDDEKMDVKEEEEEPPKQTLEIPRVTITCVDRSGQKTDLTLEGDEIPEGE